MIDYLPNSILYLYWINLIKNIFIANKIKQLWIVFALFLIHIYLIKYDHIYTKRKVIALENLIKINYKRFCILDVLHVKNYSSRQPCWKRISNLGSLSEIDVNIFFVSWNNPTTTRELGERKKKFYWTQRSDKDWMVVEMNKCKNNIEITIGSIT